jgi:hypothetical protein
MFRYLLKSHFERRIGIDNGTRFNQVTGEMRECRDTQYDRLRVSEKLELLRFLDEIGISARLILKNLRMMFADGKLKIEAWGTS